MRSHDPRNRVRQGGPYGKVRPLTSALSPENTGEGDRPIASRAGGARARRLILTFLPALLLTALCSPALALSGWFDDSFRRPIEVIWNAEQAGGYELCYVEFYTGGNMNPDGSDLRIATDEGRQVPAKVLRVGPGDKVSVIFSLFKGARKY